MGREGRQRPFAMSTLHHRSPFDDRELALGKGSICARQQRDVESEPMINRPIVEFNRQADERLPRAQLNGHSRLGLNGRRRPARQVGGEADRPRE